MTLKDWLETLWRAEKKDPDGTLLELSVTFKERLAELIHRNGGSPQVSGWGATILGGDVLYGEAGLHREEALELIYLHGLIAGFALSDGPQIIPEVMTAVKEVWRARGEDV